jgi:UDP-2,4-diacetamido-2,4,6-trideoxy-beta-L-altropyranose hydrolase
VYDRGPGVGLGHKRRMDALAAELRIHDIDCELREVDGHITGEVLIVDSYRIRADDPRNVQGGVVTAIDDLVRDLAVDLLVDPSPGAAASEHPAAQHVLAGAEYALVRPELADLGVRDVTGNVRRVLVTTGAADGRAATLGRELRRALPVDVEVRAVLGPWANVRQLVEGVVLLRAPMSLDEELAAADVVVTAGGVTMLEAMRLGRPTIALVLADNQKRQAEGAALAGAVELVPQACVARATTALVHDPARRTDLARAARALIDGAGPRRIVDVLLGLG